MIPKTSSRIHVSQIPFTQIFALRMDLTNSIKIMRSTRERLWLVRYTIPTFHSTEKAP
jgi:hypothetical protein